MSSNGIAPTPAEREAFLRQAFEIAEQRLDEYDIRFGYTQAVFEWILEHSNASEPLVTLKTDWYLHLGKPIEDLLLAKRLQPGGSVFLRMTKTSPSVIEFEIGAR